MELVIDLALLIIVGLVTYMVAFDGAWTAVLSFFAVIFGGLLAMNFFEPVATFLSNNYASLEPRADFISLVVLFGLFVFLIRLGLDHVSPTNIELPTPVYHVLRWSMGAATGYVTMAILLTALHTAPLPRKFMGFAPERKNFLGVTSPDVQWLAFTQYVSERVFARRTTITNEAKQVEVVPRSFDGLRMVFPGRQQSEYLPTFIIRYATRRERLAGGGSAPTPPPAPPPSGSGGSTNAISF